MASEIGMWLGGFAFGMTVATMLFQRQLRVMRRERQEFFAAQSARIDALTERDQRRYQDLRRKLGLPPEAMQ